MKKRILLIFLVLIMAIMSCFSLTGCTGRNIFSDIDILFSYIFNGFDDIDTFCKKYKSYETKQYTYADEEYRLEINLYKNLMQITLISGNNENVIYTEGVKSSNKGNKDYESFNLYYGTKTTNDQNYDWDYESMTLDEYNTKTFAQFEDRTIPELIDDTVLIKWDKNNPLSQYFTKLEEGEFQGINSPYIGSTLRTALMTLSITTADGVFIEYGVFNYKFGIPDDFFNS